MSPAPATAAGVSPWVSREAALPPLEGAHRAEIVVVGGGYLGLSAALRLRQSGCDVILLERGTCGEGASGRNAGHLTPTIGKDAYTCLRQWGPERGLALASFAQAAVRTTEGVIHDLGLACEYRQAGNIIAGLHPTHRPLLERAAKRLEEAGLPMDFLDEAEMQARGLPRAFRFGIHEREGGHLHPGKYLRGLRQAALAAGVRLHENTAVENLADGAQVRVRTAAGEVTADKVILATNAYVKPDLAGAAPRLLPLRVTLFRTPPLTAVQRDALGWPGGEGIYTAHEILESYRITGDGRLVGGSKWVAYGDGGPETPVPTADERQRFGALLRSRFPEAPGLEVEDCWSGWIAATIDHLPIVGSKHHDRVQFALGCNGHGIALATHLGQALAERVLGEPRPDLAVLDRWTPPVPTEALRWLAFRAVAAPLEARDRRVDRELDQAAVGRS